MFKINTDKNEIIDLKTQNFSEFGFEEQSFKGLKLKEREHLQQWIAKEPSCLGEDLLIIQEEFSDFNNTKERLDLLALDKNGALAIIENKLDSGPDVAGQAVKYASYCSGFSKKDIEQIYQAFLHRNERGAIAKERLAEFFDGQDYENMALNKSGSQRIILVAAEFTHEAKSTVFWLKNFGLKLKCLKVTPYSRDEELFLTFEQIIPTKENVMKFKENQRQKEKNGYMQFWKEFLPKMGEKSERFRNIEPTEKEHIAVLSDVEGVGFHLCAVKTFCRAEVFIERKNEEENERIFEQLCEHQEEIEAAFEDKLDEGELKWGPFKKTSCYFIVFEKRPANVFDDEQRDEITEFLIDAMVRMEKAFEKPLEDLKKERVLRNG